MMAIRWTVGCHSFPFFEFDASKKEARFATLGITKENELEPEGRGFP